MRHILRVLATASLSLVALGCMAPSDAAPPWGEQPNVLELTRIYVGPLEPGEQLEPEAAEGLFTPGRTFDRGTVETPPAVLSDTFEPPASNGR